MMSLENLQYKIILIFLSIFTITTASLFLFLIPFFANIKLKLVASTVALLFLFFFLRKKIYLMSLIRNIEFIIILIILVLISIYSFIGLYNEISIIYVLRDLRIYIIFLVLFLIFKSITDVKLLIKLVNSFMLMSLFFSVMYFFVGKLIVPDLKTYIALTKVLVPEKIEGLKMVAVDKIKYPPFLISYVQLFLLLNKKVKKITLFVFQFLLIIAVIYSNMRSVYLYWILSIIMALFFNSFFPKKYTQVIVNSVVIVILIFIFILFFPYIIEFLGEHVNRFYNQIIERGVNTDVRSNVLYFIFSKEFIVYINFVGLGLGAQYDNFLRIKFMNPIDSIIFYSYSYFGIFYGTILLLLLIYIFIRTIYQLSVILKHYDGKNETIITLICCCLSVLFCLLNGFNDTFIAFIVDATIMAALLGVLFNSSIWRLKHI